MTTNADSHPCCKTINVPKHSLHSKRWRDPSYSNRSFNAGRREAREEYTPLFPNRTPAKWNGTLTLKGPSRGRHWPRPRCLAFSRHLELSNDTVDSSANEVMSCT